MLGSAGSFPRPRAVLSDVLRMHASSSLGQTSPKNNQQCRQAAWPTTDTHLNVVGLLIKDTTQNETIAPLGFLKNRELRALYQEYLRSWIPVMLLLKAPCGERHKLRPPIVEHGLQLKRGEWGCSTPKSKQDLGYR